MNLHEYLHKDFSTYNFYLISSSSSRSSAQLFRFESLLMYPKMYKYASIEHCLRFNVYVEFKLRINKILSLESKLWNGRPGNNAV